MKFQKETLVLFVNITISFYLGFLFWDKIEFKFNDPRIVGIYSENKHNAFNDIARYIIFISLPLMSYLLTKIYFGEKIISKLRIFFSNKSFVSSKDKGISLIVFSLVLSLLILEYLSVSFPYNKIDSFHDGQKLSSAYKSFLDGSLWSGSFVTVGIFYETLSSKFIWNIFDHVSIGLMRYTEIILILLVKISLIIFTFIFTSFLNLSTFYKNTFFIFNSILLNLLINYIPGVDLISYRELPIIGLSILFLIFLKNEKTFILFLISLLSVSSLIWGVDRGIVCNILIIIILIYLILIRDLKGTLFLIFFVLVSWIFFFTVAKKEFFYFFENTLIIFKEMNYIHGLIHPKPFTDDPNSARATKTLLSIILITIFSFNLILKNNKYYSVHLKRALLYLSLVSILSYLYALGRSDGGHIKNSFGYPCMFLTIYLSYRFLLIISEKKIRYFDYSIFFLFPFMILFTFQINLKKIPTYNDRFYEFIKLKDDFFLNQKELFLVNELKPKVKNYDCIQLLSNDAALYYLLKKKSCTKYYYVWNSASLSSQKKFISELKNTNMIIEGGPKNNWDFPLEKKLFLVYENVDKDFYLHESIEGWKVYLRQE